MVLTVALRAVSTSVKPAVASFVDASSVAPKSSIGTDADSAEYAASANDSADNPDALDNSRIFSFRLSNCSPVPVNNVFTLAIDASKSPPAVIASLIILPRPNATIAFLNFAPRDFARVSPEEWPALSASPLRTLVRDPLIPSADGTICTYAFASSVAIFIPLPE